jgi:hypothetical protein
MNKPPYFIDATQDCAESERAKLFAWVRALGASGLIHRVRARRAAIITIACIIGLLV